MWKVSVILFFIIEVTLCARLSVSNDDVVIEAIRENKNLIILFTKKDCVECKYEQSVAEMRDEFESTFEGKVLKLENSQLQRIYDSQKLDAVLVFIRKGVGLLYPSDNADNAEEIFYFFNDNREPIVKELDDSSFEHLTQASTGSTTGDWLVMFYDNQCVDCNRLSATWETVGAKLKSRMNVARVNRATKGVMTAKRFKIEKVPEVIFLRMGKYYRYNLKNLDVESLVGFASSWYNRVSAERIIAPATPFENLVDYIVESLKSMPSWTNSMKDPWIIAAFASSFLFIVFLLSKKKSPEVSKKSDKGAKKQK